MELNNLPVAGHNELAVSAQAAGAMAEIQSAYVMAYHKPRDTDRARIRILNECKRPRFAEGAKYRRPVGKDKYGKQIFAEGVSIRGAEALQRCFGNVLVRSDTLYDDDRVRKISVTVIDLESNTIQTLSGMIEKTVERKYAQDREILSERETSTGGKVFILKALPHEIDLKEGALRSKLMRNCLLRLIPADILEEMDDQITATLTQQATDDPVTARKRLVDGFLALGVQPEQLKAYLGHTVELTTPQELVDLRKVYAAIQSGEARWADFQAIDVKPEPERFKVNLDDIREGDPETHTEPDEVQTPAEPEPPEERDRTSNEVWIEFTQEYQFQGVRKPGFTKLAAEIRRLLGLESKEAIPDDRARELAEWLHNPVDGGIAWLKNNGHLRQREPGDDDDE